MKINKAILILFLFFFISCTSGNVFRVNVEVPGETVFDINQFNEIIVTDFFIKNEDQIDQIINFIECNLPKKSPFSIDIIDPLIKIKVLEMK